MKSVEKYPGLQVRTVNRLGIGLVDQVYFSTIPDGGITVSNDLLEMAKVAGEMQRAKDQRFKDKNPAQSLGLIMHTYAHVIAMEFMGFGRIPYEYRRKKCIRSRVPRCIYHILNIF